MGFGVEAHRLHLAIEAVALSGRKMHFALAVAQFTQARGPGPIELDTSTEP